MYIRTLTKLTYYTRTEYDRQTDLMRITLLAYVSHEYMDLIYIRKDMVLKLTECGELNQTALLSYTGLNVGKQKEILEDMEEKGIIKRREEPWANQKRVK